MTLGTVFKLSLYGLTGLVGAILGAAEGEGSVSSSVRNDLVLPFLSLPMVICGYLFTERRPASLSSPGRGISSLWANLLGIVALCATLYEFTSESREGKLLAGTHLLLYATWIVLFQQKTIRLYWFLMALGILQLAVASVLTTRGWFGFCAIVYMFGAVWTLSIFSLWRAEQLFDEEDRKKLNLDEAERGLADSSPYGTDTPQSEVRSAVQHEDGTQWLTLRFVSGVLLTTFSALAVSTAFFMFIPRMWVGPDVALQDEADVTTGLVRKTGLATTVRLGDLGSVLESTEPVFEIGLTNLRTGRPIRIQDYAETLGMAEPLFRGAVLTSYSRGRWTTDMPTHVSQHTEAFERPIGSIDVRQEIKLAPNYNDILYCLGKPEAMADSRHHPFGEINKISGVASRGDHRNDGNTFEYEAFTSMPTQHRLNYKLRVSAQVDKLYQRISYKELNLKVPTSLVRLKELTREVLEREAAARQRARSLPTPPELTPMEIASALELYLRDSGLYRYSLDLSIDDPTIDPVEDFLFNRREGDCEYFATALALMMRSANVPTRIVSGFKGGIAHPTRKDVLEVQDRFAHLWVEAWVDDDRDSHDRRDQAQLAGWTTFDATPPDERAESVLSVAGKRTSLWAGMQTTLSGLWSENVLNMTLDRQEKSIYKPIRELAYEIAMFMQQLTTSPTAAFQSLWPKVMMSDHWFSIGGVIFGLVILVTAMGIFWVLRWIAHRIRLWLSDLLDSRLHPRRRVIEFYERFVRLMKEKGLERGRTQTHQEFAEQVASAFSPELRAGGLDETPKLISHLFYHVRFGDQDLTPADFQQIEELLSRMEQVLSDNPKQALREAVSPVT